jgi:UDP-N-acetylglucosamine 4,6-dehydratase/5-epimerase
MSIMQDQSVLITGGTGSLGRVLTQHAVAHGAKRVIVYSRDERKQEDMAQAMQWDDSSPVRFMLGDVRDLPRLEMAMYDINIVVHTAALKIIPKAEYDPFETIKTNVFGTMNVISAAISSEVQRVIGVSTDKAVSPVNLYGATKQCLEKTLVAANNLSGSPGDKRQTKFSVVRYGNVAGSRGSVIPLFLQQFRDGKPLTVTDSRMTRFWLTLAQAVDLIDAALADMHGGEIYVPRLPAFQIMALAAAIDPELAHSRRPYFIGMRPGEKLHETLITEHEARMTMLQGDWYVIHPPWDPPSLPLANGFSFSSDKAAKFLSAEELRAAIGAQPDQPICCAAQ